MPDSVDPHSSLEKRTLAAHRAYLLALLAWERLLHQMNCPICGPSDLSKDERLRVCDAAEAEKETRRTAFRDLCDVLGFIPDGRGVVLPPEDVSAACGGAAPH